MMTAEERLAAARRMYEIYVTEDRAAMEDLMADGFRFSAPPDPSLDHDGYFERCWPNAGHLAHFALTRVIESGDEVVVTYEAERADGSRFRNTEVHTVAGGKVRAVEVYFGWNL
jgi:ketosteroid isomerase-like protein